MKYQLPPEARAAMSAMGRITGPMGQDTLRRSFLADVDRETPGLDADERQTRADALYRAHMASLARQPRRSKSETE